VRETRVSETFITAKSLLDERAPWVLQDNLLSRQPVFINQIHSATTEHLEGHSLSITPMPFVREWIRLRAN
jgi:hypothetical protein